MFTSTFERSGYVAGAAFPLLAIAGVVMNEAGRGPWPGDIETEVVTTSDLIDHFTVSTVTRFSYIVLIAAAVALAWFAVSLRSRLQRAEGGEGNLARVVGGIGLVSAFTFALLFATMAGADRYDASAVDPAFLSALFAGEMMLSALWYIAILPMPFILAAAAYLGIRKQAIPKALAWFAAAAAVPGMIGVFLWPLDSSSEGAFGAFLWIGQLAFLLWCLVAGITLIATRESEVQISTFSDPSLPHAMAGA